MDRPSARPARARATSLSGIAVVLAALALAAGCSDEGGHRGGPTPSPAASTGFPFDPEMRAAECQLTDNEAVAYSAGIKLARGDKEAVAAAYTDFGRRLAFLAVAPGGTPEFAEVLSEWAGESTEVGEYVAETPKGAKIDYGPAYPRWVAAKKTAERLCGHEFPKRG